MDGLLVLDLPPEESGNYEALMKKAGLVSHGGFEFGINDTTQIDEFAGLCGDEHRLRSLFVFTCADRAR